MFMPTKTRIISCHIRRNGVENFAHRQEPAKDSPPRYGPWFCSRLSRSGSEMLFEELGGGFEKVVRSNNPD